ncbi:MAG: tyrosine-type recombinase/integrase [Leptospiraceae bacterium]|nr:tyrosine-type recombinase/integrase [Leptospiraceae bacterium]
MNTILNSSNNLKHKMILSLQYSSGLRISEGIRLKVGGIDLEEMTVRVRQGIGDSYL